MPPEDHQPTNDDVRSAWNRLATYWDEQMEAGNTWQRTLIAPAVERLLALARGERVLELACGNGEFARRMSELGVDVLATDFSDEMLDRARARGGSVRYRRVDASDEKALQELATDGPFDAIVSNMAVMDMVDIGPMATALPSLMDRNGRLVIATLHPAFNSGAVARLIEETDDTVVVRTHSIKRSTYIQPMTSRGFALEDQPVTHWYFHRSFQDILRPFFSAGWVLDALEEPVLDDGSLFAEIPGVLVVRFVRSPR